MTPLGKTLVLMRAERGITQRSMAASLGVSPAYLSALENGHRGLPTPKMVAAIIAFLALDEQAAASLRALLDISEPNVVVRTGGMSPRATATANIFARNISSLPDRTLREIAVLASPQSLATEER